MKKIILLLFTFFLGFILNAQPNRDHKLTHDNVEREYTVHVPPGYTVGDNLPLVINMHGLSSSKSVQMSYSNFNAVADTANFIVVYPQGLVGTTLWGVTDTQWDAYFGTGTKDLEFLDTLIDQMYYDYAIDLTRVYSTGMSNGGFMSYRLACELSDRIAAIASVAGAMTFQQETNCNIEHPMPILQFAGTADSTVLYNGQPLFHSSIPDLMDFWKNLNNCTLDSTVVNVPNVFAFDSTETSIIDFSQCDSFSQVQLYKITNGGHTWPGAIPVPSLGRTSQDFKASPVIWNFFRQYTYDNPTIPETISVGINKRTRDSNVEVYPNPFSNILHIVFTSYQERTLELYNILGEKVLEKVSTENKAHLDSEKLHKGIYYLSINKSKVIKVIKE